MPTYRISEEKAGAEKSLAVRRSVYIGAAALLVGAFIGVRSDVLGAGPGQRWSVLIFMIFIGLFITFFVFRTVRKTRRFLQDAYSSFELSIEGDSITKRQSNTPDVTLLRSQITRVAEYEGKGFRICTPDRTLNIWVPVELEGYEQFRAEIQSLPVEFRKEQRSWLRSYLRVALLLALFLIQGIVTEKSIAAGAAFAISAWMFWNFYAHYWNPNLTKTGRRQIFYSMLIGVALLVRGILLLRR